MSFNSDDLGVLGQLAKALGLFDASGNPNQGWFAHPEDSLKRMLASEAQREALIAFVDEALGGAERSSEGGVTWLPIVEIDDPALAVAVTIDEGQPDGLHIGLGLRFSTTDPTSATTLALPLFRASKDGGPAVTQPLLLGSAGGRIRIGTSITLDATPPVSGQARLGGIGLEVDVPTSDADAQGPVFGLALTGLQLPGASAPRDVRVSASGTDELDDALLDLVLSLVKAQADALSAEPALQAVAGLLGLRSGDAVPDFPITQLPVRGAMALADWVRGILVDDAGRADWLGHLATLLGGTRVADAVRFDVGGAAELSLALRVDSGPSGNARLTPSLAIALGNDAARVEARADVFRIDLVSGEAFALPSLGVWAAAGTHASPVLDVTGAGIAHADTLRLGFGLDVQRRLNFVLAADGVRLGPDAAHVHEYATLDLTSPDAVMDAVGHAVEDVASELLGELGSALGLARQLLGMDPPAGVPAVTLAALMNDPVAAVAGYWQQLLAAPAAATQVLSSLRLALADASEAVSVVSGSGTADDPWRLPLIGPLEVELVYDGGTQLDVALAASTRVDTLGQRCTVVGTRIAARLARIDLAARRASLLGSVEATLTARERGASPPRARLVLGDAVAVLAQHVGLRLAWSPEDGLAAQVSAPELRLELDGTELPIALPVIAADGSVTLPAEAWDSVEALVGHLTGLIGGTVGEIAQALGWVGATAANIDSGARLRLADLISSPEPALRAWLPRLATSELGPRALGVLADLFAGTGRGVDAMRGVLEGSGRPGDPYRFALADGLPNITLWFPPDGLEPVLSAIPQALQEWRSGASGLPVEALAAALAAEAGAVDEVRALVEGRDLPTAFAALAERWAGGDGRIVPPASVPDGITLHRMPLAAAQLLGALDLDTTLGRTPGTTVRVALGADAWPDAPEDRRIDLSTAGLDASMFALPAAGTGDWFVALGTRTDCKGAGSSGDGTPEQAARLARVLAALGTVSGDIAVLAVAGAGHAARLAAQTTAQVTDLVLLGTPLAPISLTALNVQPTADALRLLDRLLPPDGLDPDSDDLALGRALVAALMELAPLADPGADLRVPTAPFETPRAGLAVHAVFGVVGEERIAQALTAIVADGLLGRARARERQLDPESLAMALPTGVQAGLHWSLPEDDSGTLRIRASAQLRLLDVDLNGNAVSATGLQALQVQLRIGDALGWLAATPDLELRALSAELTLPLDGHSPGEARVRLHEARVFGQSWETLTLGNLDDAMPALPEARVLLSAALQRLGADLSSARSIALSQLLKALGLADASGGMVGDAIDQLVHDPAGLVRQRLAAATSQLGSALNALLGPLGAGIDLATRTVHVQGGGSAAGRFGWRADASISPAGLSGQLSFGPEAALPTVGGLQLRIALAPFAVSLHWHQSATQGSVAALWPHPDGQALARMAAQAAPSLAAHVALELMRRADDEARPLIDAVLDALGLLAGAAGDAERAIRPLAGLLADPVAWLRSSASLAASPVKIQTLFDGLRPLMGLPGSAGAPLAIANGVSLAVSADGAGARLALMVDPGAWAAPGGGGARLASAVGASLSVGLAGAPQVALETHLGLAGAADGRQAVHARLGNSGIELFLRPTSGADIPLVPFAGLGALSAAAEAALPFLLDKLAELPGTPGNLVRMVGDALALRSGTPKAFSADALHTWAANPVGALTAAVPSITATGLNLLAPVLDDFLPAGVSASGTPTELSIAVAGVTLAWQPASSRVSIAAPSIAVPGIETLGLALAISASGLDELSIALGPARIDAGGVLLRPFASVSAGLAPAAGRRVMLGLSADDTHHFALRWALDTASFDLVASDGALAGAVATADPAQVALRIVDVVADVVAAMAMAQQPVRDLLDTPVGGGSVRSLLAGVVLDAGDTSQLIDGMFDPATVLARVRTLVSNIAHAGIVIDIDAMKLSFLAVDGHLGLQLGVADRFALVSGDVSLWLENDDRWITPNPPGDGGIFVGFLPDAGPLQFSPTLVVNGLGLRVGRSAGPLLDAGITLESVALHVYAAIDASGPKSGGVQLQFSNLAVSASGAQGTNGVAQGIMRDTGPTPPKPAFSPALAIQAHDRGAVQVSLSAGDGAGPWWIAIQKGFGPLYLEQIGFGATAPQGRLERISLLMDGSVSMFGLTCAVDDLQITYIAGNNDFFNPTSWVVDLGGLAVSADVAGVSLAGGLLKQSTSAGTEYLGMLLGRFAVYGLTVYGGYGEGQDAANNKFTAFFAIGAVNGPIGGPPAFFLTGIGGGFGINRKLVVPTELANFADYPLVQALDIAATPSDPMTQLRALGSYFPMQKGTFWFAAGLSFNSFALVDGIAVVGVQIGDGLDINLLGLARMALPRPQAALVSIELALLVRFSSSEGVLWVQGQLTDNSWLLYSDIKLTGGFAYVVWFKGERAGEFVVTMGGYHPDFHRDGYPVVPRLGLRWSVSDNIVIKAGSYFALTSEALMTGGDFEASAHFGPAWAEVKFGAHGIVFFDPFHYDVQAYARIAAGVTIDTWIFGEITISISLGARIHVLGPEFRGSVTFEVGPIELTLAFGGSGREQKQPLAADAFVAKYLDSADNGKARPHALMTNTGTLPAKGEDSTPDGSSTRPFVVVVEFSMTFTSTVPASRVTRTQAATGATTTHLPSRALGVAPMAVSDLVPTITLTWRRDGADQPWPFADRVRPFGRFPVGIWGLPQDPNARKVPGGEMIEALSELDLACAATPTAGGPEIPYHQVEIGKRKPLPFTRRAVDINGQRAAASTVTQLLTPPSTVSTSFTAASRFLATSASPTALAALRGERQAPPRLGTLTEGLEAATATTVPDAAERPAPKVYDHFVDAPVAVGLLSGASLAQAAATKARTTVKGSERAWRIAPPTLASVEAQRSRSVAARLVITDTPAMNARSGNSRTATLIAAQSVPPSALAQAATALVARRGAPLAGTLATFSDALAVGPQWRARAAASTPAGAALEAGQTVVLKLPNARNDAAPEGRRPRLAVSGAPARVVLLAHGGRRLADVRVGPQQSASEIEIPRGTERIVAIGQGAIGASGGTPLGLAGWHAGAQLPYAGHATAIGPGCVLHAVGERLALHRERLEAGWVTGAELARGISTVTTTFSMATRTVLIVLDDPGAAGDPATDRQLVLGLDGASRALDAAGNERAPVLLTMDNRSVLAYDIVPDSSDAPVVVSIASEEGWSLAGVMASAEVDATGAVALLSSRGFDAVLQPLAVVDPASAAASSRVAWIAPTRSADERAVAKARAQGGLAVAALARRMARAARATPRKPRGQR